ncbi:F-box protein FBW2-like [Magnolia sinica]|uniref:F-box protein FBW2-like n=1 Tax=Magnolia sinica TaxID=86752 RepID=UPI002659A1F2|nr:F-box protein FBW2-like [Magnolia sinica]
MDGGGEIRCWEELIPDALELIFSNLSLQDLLTVVPMVCKSWGKAASGPHIWQEIDILEWSRQRQHKPDSVDRMLRMLITRSCGSFRKLSVCGLSNDPIFSFIADHAGSLRNLQVQGSDISDSIVELVAGRLSNITFLDISFCEKIGSRALEVIGQNCKSLVELWRRRDPTESDKVCQDDEAHAIATTMPKIKRLNMGYCLLTTRGVLEILSKCSELEFLDVTGCWDVELDEAFLKEKCASLKVRGPHIECQVRNLWDGCSDYSDSSGYLAWEYMDDVGDYDAESFDGVWDDDHGLEGLELRFYEGLNDAALGLDWPPSP